MDKNTTFIDAVLNSKHSDELKAIFDDMKATLDFDFNWIYKKLTIYHRIEDLKCRKNSCGNY